MRKASAPDKIWTVIELIRWGTDYFKAKGVDSPRLTIELMLCEVLEYTRVKLYTEFERPLVREELEVLRAMVERRAKHEPLQYILGHSYFYGLKFIVDPCVLIPRPETELLVDAAIKSVGSSQLSVFHSPFSIFHSPLSILHCLDVGTGSGCIPIAIAHHVKNTKWTCIDSSYCALENAKENAQELGVTEQCSFVLMDFREEIPDEQFDLITMNPPYIAINDISELEREVRDFEPLTALTDDADGLHFFRRMADTAHKLLKPNGILLMEIGFGQAPAVVELFEEAGMNPSVLKDLSGIERVVVVENKKVTMS